MLSLLLSGQSSSELLIQRQEVVVLIGQYLSPVLAVPSMTKPLKASWPARGVQPLGHFSESPGLHKTWPNTCSVSQGLWPGKF